MGYWMRVGAWRSLVARTVRVGEVPGSNPGAPIVSPFTTAGDWSRQQAPNPPQLLGIRDDRPNTRGGSATGTISRRGHAVSAETAVTQRLDRVVA
jgi:hypothetical protein